MTRYVVTCVAAILLANAATAERERSLQLTNTCGGTLTQPTTIAVSHSQTDPGSLNCIWNIQATAYIRIMVQSNHVNLNTDCENNFIKIYDGPLVDTEKLVATICGRSDSRLIIPASANTVTVKFSSRNRGNDFSARVYFADSEIIGCGGEITLRDNLRLTLRPPPAIFYGREMLNCIWNIFSSPNTTVALKFLTVTLPVCNNRALDYRQSRDFNLNLAWPKTCDSTCRCNFMDVWDGAVPDSYKIGSYCGQCDPPDVVSSSNSMSLWYSAVPSMGFSVIFTVNTEPTCQPTVVSVSSDPTRLQSPGYPSLARGLHCVYEFQADNHPVHLTIKNLDIQPGTTTGVCDKDKVVIEKRSSLNSLGKDYVVKNEVLDGTQSKLYEFCGSRDVIELDLQGSFFLNLVTGLDDVSHKGLEIEVVRR